MASVSAGEIIVSVKDTETFAELLEASAEFYAWFNRTYQHQPSNHPDHPWCKLGEVLYKLSDVGATCEH